MVLARPELPHVQEEVAGGEGTVVRRRVEAKQVLAEVGAAIGAAWHREPVKRQIGQRACGREEVHHHVQQDPDAALMANLDEEARVDGRPQVVIRRKEEARPISPVEGLGRIFDRQQLDAIDAEPR